jgi:hypothetical protein
MFRRAAVRLGLNTFSSIEFFLKLSIIELCEIASEVEEANKSGK